MNESLWKILELIICMAELGSFHLFLDRNCEKKKVSFLYSCLVFVLCCGILCTKDYYSFNKVVWIIICLIVYQTYSFFIYEEKVYMHLIYSGVYTIIIGVCETVCLGILGILSPQIQLQQLVGYTDIRYIFVCITKLLVIVAVIILSSFKKIKIKNYSKENIWSMVIISIISIISLYCLFEMRNNEISHASIEHISVAICVLSISILIINIIFYWIIHELNNTLNKEKEYELIQCQNKLLSKAVLDYEENNNEWRKMRHDFNNHMSCIDMLLQMENIPKARAYIQNMTHNERKSDLSIHTDNQIADAVINQKRLRARNDNIAFEVEGEIDKTLQLGDMDLCALLSNGIDNAIEAARQVINESDRKIQVVLEQTENKLLIDIKNSVLKNVDNDKKLKTTKKDTKMHGIGMMSMQTTVEKYRGEMTWKCQDYQFTLSIAIPMES